MSQAASDARRGGALPRAAIGALWGAAAASLLVPRLPPSTAFAFFAVGGLLGAVFGLARPNAEALRHPALAAVAALAGATMMVAAEPAFFVLVPLLSAALAWPFAAGGPGPVVGTRASDAQEEPLAPWVMPAVFAIAATAFFWQSAHRHWTFASGGRDLGLFYQTHWLIAHGRPLLNTVMGMPVLADHMTFDDFLVAPLLRLHDSAATLLLVQAVAVASAVFPIQAMAVCLL